MSEDAAVALRVNADRLWERLMVLAELGATPGGGVNRQALSDEDTQAWRQMLEWARAAGLDGATDAAGNLFLTLRGSDPGALPVLSGSHLDSQPTGGRFDGVYGVVAALEVLTVFAERGLQPVCDVTAVAWMNEEGSRFAPGMMGSEAFAGVRDLASIRAATDADGVSVGSALDTQRAAFPDLPMRTLGHSMAAYVEAHIEQGPVLEAAAAVVGVVTGIQGKKTFEVVIRGEAGHAGTLAMAERRDALAAFSRISSALYSHIGDHDEVVKFTIGQIRVEPNAPSVVPERVVLRIDLRHPDQPTLDLLGTRLVTLCRTHAAPCQVEVTPLVDAPGNGFDAGLQDCIEAAARRLGAPSLRLLSAAGHDARHMAPLAPSAMIFIPCKAGVSHAEHEWAEPAHIAAGADVLLQVIATRCGLA
ncbi:MAG: putative N-carbamoyl-L-amino acid hydrolase [Rhizobacter sp.]|nr:putative N-carbamoyl-L-amino acid hydrolase [Rhizobacter sp.]